MNTEQVKEVVKNSMPSFADITTAGATLTNGQWIVIHNQDTDSPALVVKTPTGEVFYVAIGSQE